MAETITTTLLLLEAVAIGASLGGPQALKTILSNLPKTFPVPIFIVQHISSGFTQGFVEWLSEDSLLKIKLALQVSTRYSLPLHQSDFQIEKVFPNLLRLIKQSSNWQSSSLLKFQEKYFQI